MLDVPTDSIPRARKRQFRRLRVVIPWVAVVALACDDSARVALIAERDAAREERDSLVRIVDELRNGRERRIAEVRDAFSKSAFDVVQSGAAALAAHHPGSEEAREAADLASRAAAAEEKARLRSEREESRTQEEKLRQIIRVAAVTTSSPNSAGGVDLSIRWQNRSSKRVKYAWFDVVAYNRVGDPVSCSIRGYSEFTGKVTGPIEPGAWYGEYASWENAWYNYSIVRARLSGVRVEYMDGSTASISPEDAKYVRY